MITEHAGSSAEMDYGRSAIVLAVAVLFDRIARLAEEDRVDMYELAKELPNAKSPEDVEEIRISMLEILDQKPVRIEAFDLGSVKTTDKLEQWKNFAAGQIRKFREQAGLTQDQLAEKTGLPQSHISRLERAQHSPSSHTIEKIAEALGVNPNQLDPSRT